MVLIGVLIAITLELSRVPALPFAVGVYLPIQISTPIFIGGMIRLFVDRMRRGANSEADTSPAVLLCSGYIAGGTIAGVVVAFLEFAPKSVKELLNMSPALNRWLGENYEHSDVGNGVAVAAFGLLMVVLLLVGLGYLLRDRDEPDLRTR